MASMWLRSAGAVSVVPSSAGPSERRGWSLSIFLAQRAPQAIVLQVSVKFSIQKVASQCRFHATPDI